MDSFVDGIGLNNLLLAVHVAALLFAVFAWSIFPPKRKRWPNSPITGGTSILVSAFFAFRMLAVPQGPTANGSFADWYLIFSVVSVGLLPAATLFCFFVTGIVIGSLIANHLVKR
ncbi:hypothetical protein ABVF61_02580 [Roseibium sp. HPY-6]|uniref:hypothetical protein n=1 Tax=Roseibium sp. HPY-6 TaxID=3229852 RepID=UPI00338FFDD9